MIPKQMQDLFDRQGHLTLTQYANLTGLSYRAVLAMATKGQLPATDVGAGVGKKKTWRILNLRCESF